MHDIEYNEYLRKKEAEFEAICIRCGECCGSADDPCRNLVKQKSGGFICKAYENRFGPQKTVSGAEFMCVSIREHILGETLRPTCAYHGASAPETFVST